MSVALHFSYVTVREHRLQRRSTDVTNSMIEDEVDSVNPKIERDIQELSKMTGSGCAKGILEDLRKIKTEGSVLDPRSSSRVPSAANEPPYKPRYESSVFACKFKTFKQGNRIRSHHLYNQTNALTNTHTHTHALTNTLPCRQAHTDKHTHAHNNAHSQTRTHSQSHSLAHKHTLTNTHTRKHTLTSTHTLKNMHTHKHTHVPTRTH